MKTKSTGITKIIKASIKSIFKEYQAVRAGFSIFHPCRHMKINEDVKSLAIQTPFSYFDIFPLYEKLGGDKDRTLRAINYCASRGLGLAYPGLFL